MNTFATTMARCNDSILQALQEGQGQMLGGGSLGVVYKLKEKQRLVAVKHIVCDLDKAILQLNDSYSSILCFMDMGVSGETYILMDFCESGNLNNVYKLGSVGVRDTLKHMYNIASGAAFLHSRGITHRNLKPENVLLAGDTRYPVCKLCDFDMPASAPTSQSYTREFVVRRRRATDRTNLFAAPEVLAGSPHRYSSDVYSCALIFLSLLTPSVEKDLLVPKVLHNGELSLVTDMVSLHQFDAITLQKEYFKWCGDLGEVISKMLDFDFASRPLVVNVARAFRRYIRNSMYLPTVWFTGSPDEDNVDSNWPSPSVSPAPSQSPPPIVAEPEPRLAAGNLVQATRAQTTRSAVATDTSKENEITKSHIPNGIKPQNKLIPGQKVKYRPHVGNNETERPRAVNPEPAKYKPHSNPKPAASNPVSVVSGGDETTVRSRHINEDESNDDIEYRKQVPPITSARQPTRNKDIENVTIIQSIISAFLGIGLFIIVGVLWFMVVGLLPIPG